MEVDVVERFSLVPGKNPLVEHGVRNGEGFQDSRRVLPDTVPDCEQTVLYIEDAVHIDLPCLHLLFEVIFLSGRLVKGCVPLVEFAYCSLGGVRVVEGVKSRPVHRVACVPEGIPDQDVGEGVLDGNVVLVSERVRIFQ